tara:strand:- start:414 stop:1472 length:1059 start_codon:yes stop_codon:yes gene_type:complete
MCGVYGFISKKGKSINMSLIHKMAMDAERRGKDAFGFAWVDDRGRIRSYKKTGPVSKNLESLGMARNARMLIGHTRMATHGSPDDNLNNHPHPVDGGWMVHNGVVSDHLELEYTHRLNTTSECDSEVIARMIEEFDGTLVKRTTEACEAVSSALVVLGLWARPSRMIIIRRGNPLHYVETKEGIYFSSLGGGLPKKMKAKEVADNTLWSVMDGPKISKHKVKERECLAFGFTPTWNRAPTVYESDSLRDWTENGKDLEEDWTDYLPEGRLEKLGLRWKRDANDVLVPVKEKKGTSKGTNNHRKARNRNSIKVRSGAINSNNRKVKDDTKIRKEIERLASKPFNVRTSKKYGF